MSWRGERLVFPQSLSEIHIWILISRPRFQASKLSVHLLETVKRVQDGGHGPSPREAAPYWSDTQEYRHQTHLHVGVFHNTPQILQYTDPRRGSTVESSERVGREDDLVIVLDEEVEHV
jgi:hypothetical protein